MNLENSILSKRSQTQRLQIVWFYVDETRRIGTFIKIGKLAVARMLGWGGERTESTADGPRLSFEGDENVLEFYRSNKSTALWITKCHWIDKFLYYANCISKKIQTLFEKVNLSLPAQKEWLSILLHAPWILSCLFQEFDSHYPFYFQFPLSIGVKCPEEANPKDRSRLVVAWGGGGGELGADC